MDKKVKDKLISLISCVFAVWTIKNSDYYLEMLNTNDAEDYQLIPHAAQVIAIFRILGIGYREPPNSNDLIHKLKSFVSFPEWKSTNGLKNHLAQVSTGQGKSIVLAVLSTVLALLDFDISCACYSQFLSQRDLLAFTEIFDAFGVSKNIHYSTFNKLCENIINQNGDVRQRILDLVTNADICRNTSIEKKPKLLLIDEVDIFFSKMFFGNVYTPVARLRDNFIIKLTDFIWEKKKENLSLNSIKKLDDYKKCCSQYEGWEFVLESAVNNMLLDVKNYSHDYVVKDGRIGYYENDSISFDISYGFKTVFAYYHEHELKKISRDVLERNVSIQINCGNFSIAEIPFEFKNIMGVTGTLLTLSPIEKEIIEKEYKINFSIIPSVYSDNKLIFGKNSDVLIEKKEDFFITIAGKIEEKLKDQRAVLVFFENLDKLNKFSNSSVFISMKEKAQNITEDLTKDEKEQFIKRASLCGQITLLTSSFGRGTDFLIYDQKLKSNGGLHVIQTFFSESLSEETQIKGRTARQGQSGSYMMILLDEDLEKILGPSYRDDIEKMRNENNFYDILNAKRLKQYENKSNDLFGFVKKLKGVHKESEQLLKDLDENNAENVKLFLKNNNKNVVTGDYFCKTICLMDATASMNVLLDKVKITVSTMFERIKDILKQHDMDANCFQMQFAVYRDYDAGPDRILQSSGWETDSNNLRIFLETQNAHGGGDYPEAIEIGLFHANEEHKNNNITQVIIIGDAPAKSKQQINDDRKKYFADTWSESRYKQITHYEKELEELINNHIPVHTFCLDIGAKENFEEIAKASGGNFKELNLTSGRSTDILTDIVSIEILNNIGNKKGNGRELLNSYNRSYIN